MPESTQPVSYTRYAPQAHVISSDEEAVAIAHEIALVLQPGAAERDRSGIVPPEIVDTFSNSGLWGITVPRRWGGAEVSAATLAQVIAIISAADPSLGQIPQNHYCLLEDIRLQGSDEQRAFFFNLVLQGHRFANALSETGGKTVLDIRTRLEARAEGLYINGRKGYCTGSLYAHWIGILALDADDKAQLAFVPRDSAGLTVVDDWACLGQRNTASGTVLAEDLAVQPFHLFPTWQSYATPTLAGPFAQLTTAAIDAGIARAALNDTVAFVREFARPWIDAGVERASDDPLTIYHIGQIDSRLAAAEALLEQAGKTLDRYRNALNEENVALASVAVARAKVFTTEVALEAASRLFELSGTRATSSSNNLDRHWRNARVHTLHDPVRWKYQLLGNWVLNGVRPQRHDWN
ncbi:SfnB family sulfur acquisition oxidoreductase [Enterobacter sp. 10-1]|uniref:SfnB family sulfur acquisition oxidoreductase n=1 Tax=Raoultella TaxID=160674 RepID=UPI000BA35225|nr:MULTISPECIES: SfnB family sulfur acquisition oxidoreductase [Enterobacteriaceae]MVT04570.1 SfnB family sulfur acquisition oxidoreductase [Raoultella sp. 10-1]PAC10650.1 SfnB family sulfur acquisition oxidoreductase [Enterobacter sp. 10-1]